MTSLRRALIALGLLAFLAGIGSVLAVLTSDYTSIRGVAAGLILLAGWGFAGTGLYTWDRQPRSNVGPLMTAIGFTWFFQALSSANNEVIFVIGILGSTLPYAILIHLLLTFPSGRIETRLQGVLVAAAYFLTTVVQLVWAVFTEPEQAGCEGCPANPLLISGHSGLSDAISAVQIIASIVLVAITVVLVVRRWRRSPSRERRALSPVLVTGALAFVFLMVQLIAGQAGLPHSVEKGGFIAAVAVFSCLPFAFLAGLLRSHIWREEEIRTALTAENEQLNEELQAKVEELRASRHRIVEAGYAERRRVERDLHDGAQQRLMALTMNLRLARERLDSDPPAAAELLDEAMDELAAATAELRELARGIHPVVLSDRGLAAALEGLADRSPVPVEIGEAPAERLPAPVESAAYFVVAEALTNVARYAEAGLATVRVARRDGAVEVEVADDGVGGADPEAGTGLRGLDDRVAALDGELAIESPAGGGTKIRARFPLAR
jgi:signal transduction histidine kinase